MDMDTHAHRLKMKPMMRQLLLLPLLHLLPPGRWWKLCGTGCRSQVIFRTISLELCSRVAIGYCAWRSPQRTQPRALFTVPEGGRAAGACGMGALDGSVPFYFCVRCRSLVGNRLGRNVNPQSASAA